MGSLTWGMQISEKWYNGNSHTYSFTEICTHLGNKGRQILPGPMGDLIQLNSDW